MSFKKIAVLTSGGDSPGMNAVLYSFAVAAKKNNVSLVFVKNGYQGLLKKEFIDVDLSTLKKASFQPGTIIGSSRCLEFKIPEKRQEAVENLKNNGVELLFVIGGNGSYMGAELISKLNFPIIAAPGTIDNDVASTSYTIGFFSAMNEIFHSIKKIKATADSHEQITFVETMGRDCCDLTIYSGIASYADYLITNKNPQNTNQLHEKIKNIKEKGERGVVILATEKVYGEKFGFNLPSLDVVVKELDEKISNPVRLAVLGHLQRGAYPTSWELFIANNFGKYAFDLVKEKKINVAIGYDGQNFYTTNISEANKMEKISNIDLINYQNGLHFNK